MGESGRERKRELEMTVVTVTTIQLLRVYEALTGARADSRFKAGSPVPNVRLLFGAQRRALRAVALVWEAEKGNLVPVPVGTSWSPEDAFSPKPASQGTLMGEYSNSTWLFSTQLL